MNRMLVSDVMTHDVITVAPDDPVHVAVEAMARAGIGGVPVTDDGHLVGILTETDVLANLRTRLTGLDETVLPSPFDLLELPVRAALQRAELQALTRDARQETVAQVMTTRLHVARPTDPLEVAAARMTQHDVNRLPVVEEGRLVGIVTRGDLVRGLAGRRGRD